MEKIKDIIARNILFYRRKNKVTQKELAEKLGIQDSTISSWEKGINSVNTETLFKICEILNVSLNDMYGISANDKLYTDEEKAHLNNYRQLDIYGKDMVDTVLNKELKRIQQEAEKAHNITDLESVMFFDLPVSAGTGVFLDSENCEHIDFPADEVPQGTDFALRIHGDSMDPLYADGSTVFVRVQPAINDGEVGIFVLNSDGYIKRLEKKNGSTYLVSENPKYKPIKILDTDTISCVGKVLN